MASQAVTVETSCPLCGTPLLSWTGHGYVRIDDLRTVPLQGGGGGRFALVLCEDCASLAHWSPSTLN